MLLASMLHGKRQTGEALGLYKAMAQKCSSAEAYYQCGVLLTAKGALHDVPRGMDCLLRAGRLGSDKAKALILQVQREARHKGESEDSDTAQAETQAPSRAAGVGLTPADMSDEDRRAWLAALESFRLPDDADADHPSPVIQHTPGQSILEDPRRSWAVMKTYLALHPTSFCGWGVFLSLLHVNHFVAGWEQQRPEEEALGHLFNAYMFDDKAVLLPISVLAEVKAAVSERLTRTPNDCKTLVLHFILQRVFGDVYGSVGSLSRAITPAGTPTLLQRRLLPRLLHMQGGMACFTGDPSAAVNDFERAAHYLQSDPATSIWPYDPPVSAGQLSELRRAMELDARLFVGRGLMMSTAESDHQRAAVLLQEFVDHADPDCKLYVQAHFDLIQCSMPSLAHDPDKLQRLIERGESFVDKGVPVFPQVTAQNFPKIEQARALLTACRLQARCPGRAASAGPQCTGCGVPESARKLMVCSGCGHALFCSKECQKKHKDDCKKWKENSGK
jgi:hypothetical protein